MTRTPYTVTSTALMGLLATALMATAAVTEEEAAKLKTDLTPMGAIRAGNAAGTIPAWTGGITNPPAEYKPRMHHPDPFADDEPLYTITAENAEQYADVLCEGQREMFRRYPETWRMTVYPTRRSASFPRRIYEAAIANATTAKTVRGGNGVENASQAIPFPIPQSGVETIWNHILRYRGQSLHQVVGQAVPTAGGQYTMVMIDQKSLFPYTEPGATIESINNRAIYFLQTVTAPARLAGQILLVHETLDQIKEPRKAWTYNPGQRRVRRAPNIAYDNPGTASDGQRTTDQFDVFNGAPDRYDWNLIGRKELIVPYNSYKLHSASLRYKDIIKPGHINPDYTRYERHRVWVTDATLKEGMRHIYARRTFYFDEDSWQLLWVDQYDARGRIWRVSEVHPINYYEVPLFYSTLECVYDLQNGRYLAIGLNNQGEVEEFNIDLSPEDFTPAAIRRLGLR